MNPLPPNADELVSAYVDGQATPDEIVAVEASPELMAQVEALRALSGQLGSPLTPPASQKEAHLAAALGAFDELFADSDPVAAAAPAAASLRAVPDPEPAAVGPAATTTTPETSTVTSFDAAKDRRRPRRFNIGIIAAALAAVLLIIGLSVLGGGGRSNDTATSSVEADFASDAASDASDDAVEEAMADDEEDAMVEAAMDEELSERTGGLSDAGSANAAPAPTAPPPAAASEAEPQAALDADGDAEAMVEDAMDDEEAMEEEAMDEEETSADFDAAELDSIPFFFGEFADVDALGAELTAMTNDDVIARKAGIGQGVFARCQAQIPEFAEQATATLIGEAVVNDQPREIHLFAPEGDNELFYVVDPSACTIVAILG